MIEQTTDEGTVVVGIDGSPGSAVALRWALEHADHLGRVVPVAAYVAGPFEQEFGTHTRSESTARFYRSEMVALLTEFLESQAPELVSEGVVLERPAGSGLVEASADAELLVVGTRGWAEREGLAIGSVGAYCARHAKVPVALIPHEVPPVDDRLSVVVGVDGSPQAAHALRWTLDHVRWDAVVTAVMVTTGGPIVGDPSSASAAEVEAAAGAELERIVADVVAGAEREVEMLVVSGDPRDELGAAVARTDLLVVGARGHGVIHRLMVGSVAMALVHHPTLPTIVVPRAGS